MQPRDVMAHTSSVHHCTISAKSCSHQTQKKSSLNVFLIFNVTPRPALRSLLIFREAQMTVRYYFSYTL